MVTKILTGILILLIFWLQYQIWYVENGQSDHQQKSLILLQKEMDEQIEQNKQLVLQNKKLKKEIWLLRNDPDILEEKAREQIGLIKDGEIFYRIIPREQ